MAKRRTVSLRSHIFRLTHLVSLSLNGVFRPTELAKRRLGRAIQSAGNRVAKGILPSAGL